MAAAAPRRAIFTEAQLRQFQRSTAHRAIVELVKEGARAIRGVSGEPGTIPVPPVVARLKEAFAVFDGWIDDIPPINQPMRFGNRAFVDWHRRLMSDGPALISHAIHVGLAEASAAASPTGSPGGGGGGSGGGGNLTRTPTLTVTVTVVVMLM